MSGILRSSDEPTRLEITGLPARDSGVLTLLIRLQLAAMRTRCSSRFRLLGALTAECFGFKLSGQTFHFRIRMAFDGLPHRYDEVEDRLWRKII